MGANRAKVNLHLGLKICCKRNKSDRRVEITLPVQHRESKEGEKREKGADGKTSQICEELLVDIFGNFCKLNGLMYLHI